MSSTPATSPEPLTSGTRHFRPDAATLARLAEDLSCPDFTLREIAQRYDTSLEKLSLYLLSEPALAHVAALEAAAAIRVRLAATSHPTQTIHPTPTCPPAPAEGRAAPVHPSPTRPPTPPSTSPATNSPAPSQPRAHDPLSPPSSAVPIGGCRGLAPCTSANARVAPA